MFKPMNTQAQALTFIARHFIQHRYNSSDSEDSARKSILNAWELLNATPVMEFSPAIWDDLNDVMQEIV